MTRIERLQSRLPAGCCALITSDINRRYFTGMKSSAGAALIFPERAYLLIDFRYVEKARETAVGCEVVQCSRLYDDILRLAKDGGAERIWIESGCVTLSQYGSMKKALDGPLTVCPDSPLSSIVTEMRQIKSEEEIELIAKAQRIAEKALEDAFDYIGEGVTEREIALFLNDRMLRSGAEELSFETIVLSGKNTSMPHGVPSDKPVRKGELILMDFGAVCGGYHSDMTRTVALGEPEPEAVRVYNTVLQAQEKALAAAKAGITGRELDKIARDHIAANGFGDNFGHGLGHSAGMEIHETPCANTRDETVLKENMIMTVEPGIYIPGKFGVRIEDITVIKTDNCVNLTNAPKNLIKL